MQVPRLAFWSMLVDNDHVQHTVDRGMQPEEASLLKKLLAGNNNRTLTCNGSHLPLIAAGGLEIGEMARPATLPPVVTAFCRQGSTKPA